MKELIKEISKKTKLSAEKVAELIEIPPQNLGDYAFPCFHLAKPGKSPVKIAAELMEKIKLKNIKVEQKGPYINFFVDKKQLVQQILKNKLKKQKKGKIIIEHTSINPNASPHMGRIRNSLLGDSIVRILKFSGYTPEVHYYVNDVSKQIAMLALICKGKEKFSELIDKYKDITQKIIKAPELEKKVFDLLARFEKGDNQVRDRFKEIVDTAVKGQKQLLEQLGIRFDSFDYESNFLKEQKNILKMLKKTGKLYKDKDNRFFLKQPELTEMMKEPVFILTRSDNTGLYPLRDLAYTIWKMKKGKNLIILGEDQKLYFLQLKEALKLLKKQAPDVMHYSYVLISEKGLLKKMATRRGEGILLEDFLKEAIKEAIKKTKSKQIAEKVALAAIKYTMLRNEPNKNIIFDLDSALQFEGNTGPYLLYSYARASSILKKAKTKGKMIIENISNEEFKLLKKINDFSSVVEQAEQQLNPALLAHYSHQLSQIFNEFYHSEKVIGSAKQAFKIEIIKKFMETLKNSLSLLGIETVEKM